MSEVIIKTIKHGDRCVVGASCGAWSASNFLVGTHKKEKKIIAQAFNGYKQQKM